MKSTLYLCVWSRFLGIITTGIDRRNGQMIWFNEVGLLNNFLVIIEAVPMVPFTANIIKNLAYPSHSSFSLLLWVEAWKRALPNSGTASYPRYQVSEWSFLKLGYCPIHLYPNADFKHCLCSWCTTMLRTLCCTLYLPLCSPYYIQVWQLHLCIVLSDLIGLHAKHSFSLHLSICDNNKPEINPTLNVTARVSLGFYICHTVDFGKKPGSLKCQQVQFFNAIVLFL